MSLIGPHSLNLRNRHVEGKKIYIFKSLGRRKKVCLCVSLLVMSNQRDVMLTNVFLCAHHYITASPPMGYLTCHRDDVIAGVGLQFDGSY